MAIGAPPVAPLACRNARPPAGGLAGPATTARCHGRVEALDAVAAPGAPPWSRWRAAALGRDLPASRPGLHRDRCPVALDAVEALVCYLVPRRA
jgi:hypothetical protein